MQYGTISGRFLVPDGRETPLTGRIVFQPTRTISEPGTDYPRAKVTGFLSLEGELSSSDGSPFSLAYGEWEAFFYLYHNGEKVYIHPIKFVVSGDMAITTSQDDSGNWTYEIVPLGDGTANLTASHIILHGDGTATLRMA